MGDCFNFWGLLKKPELYLFLLFVPWEVLKLTELGKANSFRYLIICSYQVFFGSFKFYKTSLKLFDVEKTYFDFWKIKELVVFNGKTMNFIKVVAHHFFFSGSFIDDLNFSTKTCCCKLMNLAPKFKFFVRGGKFY